MENQKKSETNQVPVRYVKQPWNISTITRSLTLQETHILAEIMDAVSDRVGELLLTSPDKDGKLLLFNNNEFDEDGDTYIDIPFSSLTSRSDCYKQVEEVANKLCDTKTKFEVETDDEIAKYTMNMFIGVASVVNKNNRRTGMLRFLMNKKQARLYMDFSRYSRYIKAVVRNCKSVFTARMYWLITAYRDFGVYTVKYKEMRRYLGFDVYNEESHKWEDTGKYSEYRLFKRRILNTADAELKKLAEEGNVDCYFDLEEIFGSDPKTPDKLKFIIHKTDMGKLESDRLKYSKVCIDLENKMKTAFGMSITDCKSIIELAGNDRIDFLSARVDEIKKYIDKMLAEGKKVSVKKYAIKSLRNALVESIEKIEETIEGKIEDSATSRTEQSRVEVSDKDKEKWSRVVELLNGSPAVEGMTLSADETGVYVSVPTPAFVETFSKEADIVKSEGYRIIVHA